MPWQPVYVGLGSNLGEPPQQIRRALQALGTMPDTQLLRHSRLYRSRPLGPVVQADFCNAVAALQTRLDAVALHAALRALELSLGRDPVGSAGVRASSIWICWCTLTCASRCRS